MYFKLKMSQILRSFVSIYDAVKCNLTELTIKSACVPLEVSGVNTYAHVSEFHVFVDCSIA